MAAPLGNTNARSARQFRDTLRRVTATYTNKTLQIKRGQAEQAIAEQLVEQAASGTEWAIKEYANRTDGKSVQIQDIGETLSKTMVLVELASRVGITQARKALKAAGADNLVPLLETIELKPEREPVLIEQS